MGSIALEGVSTLEQIVRNERKIQVWCDKCRALHRFTQDELVSLMAMVGPDFSFINRRCRCRLTPGCNGWNRFEYLLGVYRPMTDPLVWSAQVERDRRGY